MQNGFFKIPPTCTKMAFIQKVTLLCNNYCHYTLLLIVLLYIFYELAFTN